MYKLKESIDMKNHFKTLNVLLILLSVLILLTACVASDADYQPSDPLPTANPPVENTPPTPPAIIPPPPPPNLPQFRWLEWEKMDFSIDPFSSLEVLEKPDVCGDMAVTFINAGETVILPDGRVAELALYINPDLSFFDELDGVMSYSCDYVLLIGNEVHYFNTESSLSSLFEAVLPSYVVFIDDNTIYLVTEQYTHTHHIYRYDNTAHPYIGYGYTGCFEGRIERIESDLITGSSFHIVLGTRFLSAKYTYDGLINEEPEGMYWFTQRSLDTGLTLLVDIEVHKSNAAGAKLEASTLPAGTEVYPELTNRLNVIVISTKAGDWYLIDDYNHFHFPQEIGGKPIEGIFDGMPFAGQAGL
jgi:hypothetical protein